jgi:ParB-like chromosome segregation protein Spo0J/16S rRNA G966 N2-methylase RsmD
MTEDTKTVQYDDPFEIDEVYESLFDDLEPEQYESIKASIRKHGVDTAILIDAENKVIDGHHRLRAVRELRAEGHDIPDIPFVQKPTRVDKLRAFRANIARRTGHKKAGVKNYLREHLPDVPEGADTGAEVMWPDDDDAWTERGVKEELGVSKGTVHNAIEDSIHVVRSDRLNIPSQREQKRDAVRSYIESNPDATDNEVVDAVDWDISQPTVSRWRNDMFDERSDEDDTDTEQSSIVGAGSDAEDSSEIAQDAADGEETATETLSEEGTTTTDSATKTRDKKQKEKEKEKDEQRREEQRESFKEAVKDNSAVEVHHGDFKRVLSDYDDSSIDHIITDPPYDKEALELWEQLATVAADKLKDGGYLIAYSGQSYLPQVYDILSNELNYIWQLTVSHESEGKHPYHSISIGYKPVLLFGKETSGYRGSLVTDTVDIGAREKDEHEWQQSAREASKFVEKFTEPNDIICDPMCGSGTTGIAAIQNDRQAILIDNDAEAIDKTKNRISEVIKK